MKKELVMYHGERVHSWTKKVYQLFKNKKGKEYQWNSIKGIYFGSIYEIERKADGSSSMLTRPKEIEEPWRQWEPTEKERLEYEAQKAVVTAQRQARLKEFKLKRPHKDLTKAVELFRPFYRALTDNDRRRLVEWFANEASKKK